MRREIVLAIAVVASIGGPGMAEPLATALKLTPAQQPFFTAWVTTRQGDPQRQEALAAQELSAHTAPDLMINWQAWAEYRLVWSRVNVDTMRNLYGVLTPTQRALLDAAVLSKTEKDAPPVEGLPAEPRPTLPDPNAAARINPEWSRKPNGDELSAFYPLRAEQERVGGSVTISCNVNLLGMANSCVVDNEEPAGYGFGNATIEVAGRFRFHPATVYGVPVNATVTIPLNWQLMDEAALGAKIAAR